MFVKKAFSALTSKLPKLLKTITSKLPSTLSSIANSGNFSQVLNFLKSNQNVPQSVRHIATTVTDPRFIDKLGNVGTNAVGMSGAAMLASSILGPQAGLAIQAVGMTKDAYDLYKGYQQVDQKIRNQENQRTNRNNIQKISSINPNDSRSVKNVEKTRSIFKQSPRVARVPNKVIGGYRKLY